jgi:protein-S-isoprenylcysteine O-methyltransferase Ste14
VNDLALVPLWPIRQIPRMSLFGRRSRGAVAVLAGLALNWLMPLPFVPAASPAGWLGAMVFALALALVAWAIATITRAGSNVPTRRSTTTIVDTGPYRVTRNPIYLGILGLIGLAIDPPTASGWC